MLEGGQRHFLRRPVEPRLDLVAATESVARADPLSFSTGTRNCALPDRAASPNAAGPSRRPLPSEPRGLRGADRQQAASLRGRSCFPMPGLAGLVVEKLEVRLAGVHRAPEPEMDLDLPPPLIGARRVRPCHLEDVMARFSHAEAGPLEMGEHVRASSRYATATPSCRRRARRRRWPPSSIRARSPSSPPDASRSAPALARPWRRRERALRFHGCERRPGRRRATPLIHAAPLPACGLGRRRG
jgi:hypothetical protein